MLYVYFRRTNESPVPNLNYHDINLKDFAMKSYEHQPAMYY